MTIVACVPRLAAKIKRCRRPEAPGCGEKAYQIAENYLERIKGVPPSGVALPRIGRKLLELSGNAVPFLAVSRAVTLDRDVGPALGVLRV